MKISKPKTRSRNNLQIHDEVEREKNAEESMVIENVPLDDNLWEDWQRVTAIDREPKVRNLQKKTKLRNKQFCNLRQLFESSAPDLPESVTRRKNKILRDFVSSECTGLPVKITICRTIVPDEIRKKRNRRSKNMTEVRQTDSRDESNPEVSILGDASHNEESNSALACPSLRSPESCPEEFLEATDDSKFPHFYSLRGKVLCVMEPGTKFSFQGKLKVQVLYGAVNIYGVLVRKENTTTPLEVYSSRCSSLISIEATQKEHPEDETDLFSSLRLDRIFHRIPNDIENKIKNLKPGWAVLNLQNLENNLTTFLNNFSTHRLFPKVENTSSYSWSDRKRAELVLQTNIYPGNSGRAIGFHRTEEICERILKDHSESDDSGLRILVAGGKSVGKSTTGRYFVNRLLEISKTVLFVDLDLGQAEFTPSGCISVNVVQQPLLGANFTHLRTPYHQIYVGGADPTKYLMNYIEGVRLLYEFLERCEELEGLPVVINTMGFCKGIGWDIMCYVIRMMRPNQVVQITSKRAKNNYDQLLTCEIMNRQNPTWNVSMENIPEDSLKYQLHVMETEAESPSQNGEQWNIEPYQQREIVMLAYLSGILNAKRGERGPKHELTSINEVVPYEVPFSAVKISLGKPLVPQILSVMNGNIVAMCGIVCQDTESSESREKVGYPEVMMRAPPAVCYGFGILRGIDMTKEKLYINTPLSLSELKHVNCLIGSIPVPYGLLQLISLGLPYTGDECELPTSRDPRRGYLRMRNRHDIGIKQ
ncbi:polynucleotide 5'-hydroxyl-kinase NOL9 [Fopius arisanus]|uniref:Polynucleotide 5'-hydroxyl-kinase NOL9 n=1 Tax=Fopius arisanus TaxID=64838 RepID=A0A9R1TTC5_9HYME|nr:PREDICTED: polynucleotide 5'-hydroxyl-kinase NOL9 [Fopius arisanus]